MLVELLKNILSDTIAIFTIMNPLAASVIMLSLMEGDSDKAEIRAIAARNSRAVFIAMIVIFFSGTYIFNFFGISPNGLRVFGGIILFLMGFNMIQGHGKRVNHSPKEQRAALDRNDISIVPLAIPIIVGGGLVTTLINMSISAESWMHYLSGAIAIVICSLANLFIMQRAPFIKKRLGENGLKIFNRLMGLIVGSLATQMVVKGLVGLYELYLS